MSKHRTTCPKCQKAFNVTLEMQGKRCRCSKCQHKFVINIETPLDIVLGGGSPKVATGNEDEVVPVVQTPAAEPPPLAPDDDEVVEVTVTTKVPEVASQTKPPSRDTAVPADTMNQSGHDSSPHDISPFEELAGKLMTAHQTASQHQVYDPRNFMAYSTNADMASKDFVGERNAQLVIRGGALCLVAIMLLPLVFLGIHLSGSSLTCPTGGLLAVLIGGIGSIMMLIGLRSNAMAALTLGILPGLGFLASGVLVVFLTISGYWGSGFGFQFDQLTSPGRNQLERSRKTFNSPEDNDSGEDRLEETIDDLRDRLNSEFEGNSSSRGSGIVSRPEQYAAVPLESIQGNEKPLQFDRRRESLVAVRSARYRKTQTRFNAMASGGAGKQRESFIRYFANKESTPMTGLNLAVDRHGYVIEVTPVFEGDSDALTEAKESYVVGGVNLYVDSKGVRGIQCRYVRWESGRIDVSDSYLGDWVGQKPAPGAAFQINGNGRMVVGLWVRKIRPISTFGLLLQSD